eukprot:30973-Pelagococcus_subviridis.AAC.17
MSMRRAAKAVAQAAARASRPDVAIAPARYPRHRYLSDMPGASRERPDASRGDVGRPSRRPVRPVVVPSRENSR